jgi:CheY-like chemotaxis protein
MKKNKVLVVEDDTVTKNFLSQLIERLGYKVDSCENGLEAIKKIKSFKPDLILSDVLMPECSGLQLLNYIQKKTPSNIPIVLISSLDLSEMEGVAKEVGAVGFIPKPPREDKIAEMFEKAFVFNINT